MIKYEANEGYIYVRTSDGSVVGTRIYLGVNDNISNYNEVLISSIPEEVILSYEELTDLYHKATNDIEEILQSVKNGLSPLPIAGEAWSSLKNYIRDDTVLLDSILYTALKYNKNKKPDENLDCWEEVPQVEELTPWTSIVDGTVIYEGDKVSQDGKNWICVMQHMKSTVYKPKAGSSRWEEIV